MNLKNIPVRGIIIWLLAAFFFLYEFFLRTFIGSLAQQILPDLNLNIESFALIASAYYVTYGVMQIPVGVLVDRFDIKNILIFAVLLCGISTLLFSQATHFYSALLSRLLMGFGSSFAFVCLLIIVSIWFPKRYYGFFIGASQFLGTMGPLLAGGPFIALMTVYHFDWRTMLIYISLTSVALSLLIFLIMGNKNKIEKERHFKQSFSLTKQINSLLRNSQVWWIALYSGTNYIAIVIFGAVWGTEYLQARGLTQTDAASMISLAWFGYAIGCLVCGFISDLMKKRKPLLIFCSILGIVITSFIIYVPFYNDLAYSMLFFGLGVAASGQNIGFAAIAESSTPYNRATALGFNNAMITLFSSFIPPLITHFIFDKTGGIANLTANNFFYAFRFIPFFSIASLGFALFLIQETYSKQQRKEPVSDYSIEYKN